MPRFFMAGSSLGGGTAIIGGTDAGHIRVLRLKLGDEIIVCDGEGNDHRCRISRFTKTEVEAEILDSTPCLSEPRLKCTVLAGFPRGERADYIVQKCTELGASEIVFFQCTRCIARPAAGTVPKKLERFQRIAEEAAKQSGRGVIPRVSYASAFDEALDIAVKSELKLMMYEAGDGRVPLREALKAAGDPATASLMTGPEGGFEKFETELAAAVGIKLCSMGPRILRCETAPAAALAALMYETGNLE